MSSTPHPDGSSLPPAPTRPDTSAYSPAVMRYLLDAEFGSKDVRPPSDLTLAESEQCMEWLTYRCAALIHRTTLTLSKVVLLSGVTP